MLFPTQIMCIPCQIDVTLFLDAAPTLHEPEPVEFEFDILDRDGNPAEWMRRLVTLSEENRLIEEYRILRLAETHDYKYFS